MTNNTNGYVVVMHPVLYALIRRWSTTYNHWIKYPPKSKRRRDVIKAYKGK